MSTISPAKTSSSNEVLPQQVRIVDALQGRVPVDSTVTIQGWVRTRRDSKSSGGLSFINVHDGSCFDPIQVVAGNTLANYQSDVLRLTTSCSVIVEGTLVQSQGKGQSVEVQASSIKVIGW